MRLTALTSPPVSPLPVGGVRQAGGGLTDAPPAWGIRVLLQVGARFGAPEPLQGDQQPGREFRGATGYLHPHRVITVMTLRPSPSFLPIALGIAMLGYSVLPDIPHLWYILRSQYGSWCEIVLLWPVSDHSREAA